jgi:hypothetical protein
VRTGFLIRVAAASRAVTVAPMPAGRGVAPLEPALEVLTVPPAIGSPIRAGSSARSSRASDSAGRSGCWRTCSIRAGTSTRRSARRR